MEKRDWKKVVADSNGQMVFLPVKLEPAAKEVEKLREDFNKEALKMAQKEITMNMKTQEMFFAFRKFLSDSGAENIWLKEVGFNLEALKEGLFIVNILDQK